MTSRLSKRTLILAVSALCAIGIVGGVAYAASLKKGLKVYVIPKNLGNSYFTTADSVKTGGALAALKTLGETGTETSGTAATAASQLPAIQASIAKGANILIVSATDPTALCSTLKSAAAKGITVVTYDSDAPTCRSAYVENAPASAIGESEVVDMAQEIGSGQIAIVSAEASATNQNVWIGYMKTELKKYPKLDLVDTVYGNDDPTTATQVTQGLLQKYPKLKGIISPTTVGILAAAQVIDAAHDIGKVKLTGLGTPLEMKAYIENGTSPDVILWDPARTGTIAAYLAVNLASKTITDKTGQSFTAGSYGKETIGPDGTIDPGGTTTFTKANVGQFSF
ncbi:MAG: substrate-binding domain-containing protein [Solirubrobacteraceae bacterium]|jgi:rhamnose transport system substrate-binding protein